MNYLIYSTSLNQHNKEYFVNLIRIAKANDIICQTEFALLHQIGRKLGFTEPEIKNLIDTAVKQDYNPPYELSKRFEQLYDIVKIALADGQIDNHEIRLARDFAAISGFRESEIPPLLVMIMRGIKEGKDEEDLFEVYKNTRKSL